MATPTSTNEPRSSARPGRGFWAAAFAIVVSGCQAPQPESATEHAPPESSGVPPHTAHSALGEPACGASTDCSAGSADANHAMCTMVQPDIDWKLRAACETRLLALPAGEVLPLVAKQPLREMGFDVAIWNGAGSAEGDQRAPWRWQVHYALSRVWEHHVAKTPPAQLRQILAAGADGQKDEAMARILIFRKRHAADPELFAVALAVMRDAKRSLAHRSEAAQALLELDRPDAYSAVCDFALARSSLETMQNSLVAASIRAIRVGAKPDRRLVRRLFEQIEAATKAAPDDPNAGYFDALAAGDLVGQKFAPDPKPYDGGARRKDAFFADTVQRALAWWRAHRNEFSP